MKVDTAPFMQLDQIVHDITNCRMKMVFSIKADVLFCCENGHGKESSFYVL
jgi:hypothetical protein